MKFKQLLIFLIVPALAFGQIDTSDFNENYTLTEALDIPSDPPKKTHRFSIRLSSGVPNPISSELFRKSMMGIYELNICALKRFKNYAYYGLGINYTLLSISNKARFDAKTQMQYVGYFTRIGKDIYLSKHFFQSIFLNIGYSRGYYSEVVNSSSSSKQLQFEIPFIQPAYSINFLSEERLSLGFYAAWQYMFWKFKPEQINLSDTGLEISKYGNNARPSIWIIGLEMYIGLGKNE